jgi:hypothetical protein
MQSHTIQYLAKLGNAGLICDQRYRILKTQMPVCRCRSDTHDFRKKSYAGQTKSPAFRHLLIAVKVSWYFSSSLFDQLEELPWDAEQMIVDYFSFCYVFLMASI